MHKRHKYDIIVLSALLAFAVSLFLSISKAMNYTVPCDVTKGCETVLSSQYSILIGIPLAYWGTAFFAAVIVSALLANHYKLWRRFLTALLGVGAAASLVFLGLQFFVIRSVCQYCLITDVMAIALLLWDLNIERATTVFPPPDVDSLLP